MIFKIVRMVRGCNLRGRIHQCYVQQPSLTTVVYVQDELPSTALRMCSRSRTINVIHGSMIEELATKLPEARLVSQPQQPWVPVNSGQLCMKAM